MGVIIGILRAVIPLLAVFLLMRFLMPRFRRSEQRSDRIDVDATVVNSEQNKVDLNEYEPSQVYVKRPSSPTDTKEQ